MTPASPEPVDFRDAYLRWFLSTRSPPFRTTGGQRDAPAIGLIVEWTTLVDAAVGVRLLNDLKVPVPRVYAGPPRLRRIWAISVPLAHLDATLDAVAPHVRRVELASPTFFRGSPYREARRPRQSAGPVFAAVLDDGCAFAHRRFRDADGTRVIWLWDQDAERGGRAVDASEGPSPAAGLGYGRQWAKSDLDTLIAGVPGGDEGAVYEALGTTALRRRAMHGTHVMDLFVGGTALDVAFVQFPAAGIDDPTGRWLARYALDGLHYALECAGPQTTKIVVNLSWGPQTGPHDGTSPAEVAIEELVAEHRAAGRELVVCLPSGNTFGARAHGCVDTAVGAALNWQVPPDGEAPAFLEIWWPSTVAAADIRLRITPPGGAPKAFVSPATALDGPGWSAFLQQPAGQGAMVLVAVNPTGGRQPSPGVPRGPSGAWGFEFDAGASGQTGDIHLYVARADHNMGARRLALASHLGDAKLAEARFRGPADRDAEAPGSAVQRAGTLNGMATGASTRVVSGYEWQGLGNARYSSAGPSRGGARRPDFACVTDRSRLRTGVAAAGVRSGTKATLVGTSTAAPQLARRLAEEDVPVLDAGPGVPPLRDGEPRIVPADGLIHRA